MSHTIAALRAKNPMWVYERNYAMLVDLFPKLMQEHMPSDEARIELPDRAGVCTRIVERCRYTLTMVLAEVFKGDLVPEINMNVRLYHDAGMAEVIAYQGFNRLLPKYRDLERGRPSKLEEKRQANLLLYDWLSSLLKAHKLEPSSLDYSTE